MRETSPMRKPPTGEPYAGKPHVRFGGRGGESLPDPYQGPQAGGPGLLLSLRELAMTMLEPLPKGARQSHFRGPAQEVTSEAGQGGAAAVGRSGARVTVIIASGG